MIIIKGKSVRTESQLSASSFQGKGPGNEDELSEARVGEDRQTAAETLTTGSDSILPLESDHTS